MVVLAVFPDNDLMENLGPEPVSLPWPPREKQGRRLLTPGFIRYTLGTNSFLRSILCMNDRVFKKVHPSLYRAEKAVTRGLLHIYSRSPTPIQIRMWDKLSLYLRSIQNSIEANGAVFAVMIVPGTIAFNPIAIKKLSDEKTLLRNAQLDPLHPRSVLIDSLNALGIRWIDLLSDFRRFGTETSDLYFPIEGHWNEAGNRIAGECLALLISDGMEQRWQPQPVATSDSSCVRSSVSESWR